MNSLLRTVPVALLVFGFTVSAFAAEAPSELPRLRESTIKPPADVKLAFKYDNGEVITMISDYAKATGQKFIVDPGVRGKGTIIVNGTVTAEEAFNHLCDVLSINGFALVEQGDTMIVKFARNAQRDAIPTYRTLPPARPNRMVTWLYTPKYVKVEELNKRLRILPSKDGEMVPFEPSNTLIVSDYSANINRIAELMGQIDTPETAKWVAPPPRRLAPGEMPRFKHRSGGSNDPTQPPRPPKGKKSAKTNDKKENGQADELDRLFEDSFYDDDLSAKDPARNSVTRGTPASRSNECG